MANTEQTDLSLYRDVVARELAKLSDSAVVEIAIRGARLYAGAAGKPIDESTFRAMPREVLDRVALDYGVAGFGHGSDGRHAVARKLTAILRSDDSPACDFADRPDVNGSLASSKMRAKPCRAQKQAKIAASQAAPVRASDQRAFFDTLRASMRPGGASWLKCRSRANKRNYAKRVHHASQLADAGQVSAAITFLKHGTLDV